VGSVDKPAAIHARTRSASCTCRSAGPSPNLATPHVEAQPPLTVRRPRRRRRRRRCCCCCCCEKISAHLCLFNPPQTLQHHSNRHCRKSCHCRKSRTTLSPSQIQQCASDGVVQSPIVSIMPEFPPKWPSSEGSRGCSGCRGVRRQLERRQRECCLKEHCWDERRWTQRCWEEHCREELRRVYGGCRRGRCRKEHC